MSIGHTDGKSRRDTDGRYSYDISRLCRCGHILGSHLGAGPVRRRACIAHEVEAGADINDPCDCEGFRPARTKGNRS